ncbi:MAG: VWA domain-containing protein, partial [Pseudomonadota bacterium]
NPDAYDSMMNYEAVVLEANQQLVAKGEEPLHLIYPANGLAVADSPLCKVDRGDDDKDEAFAEMQAHLLSKDVQEELLRLGRRTGLIGAQASTSTGGIWNADWGVDPDRAVAPVPTPASEVIREALRLYQTELRKPSLTIWVLDVSGSMEGEPLAQLKNAMTLLLDPESAQLNLLQPSARDITVVIPFSGRPKQPFIVTGIDPGETQSALDKVRGLRASGGTDLYGALAEAFKLLEPYAKQDRLDDYLPAIVAMTDGASSSDNRGVFLNYMNNLSFGRDVPVHAIAFGKADEDQLRELNDATIGRLFKAGDDLAKALRSAKGYN